MSMLWVLLLNLISLSFGLPACDVCKEAIHQMDVFIAENSTIVPIEELATEICEIFHAGGECEGPADSWQCEQVCQLAVQTYEPMVDYLLIRYLDPAVICYNIENNTFGCDKPKVPDPTPVPNIIRDNSTHNKYNDTNKIGYILQIPDLHWGQQYKENSVANCGEPVCCRAYDNDHNYSYPLVYGGKYGIANESINCDAPLSTIQSMIDYISNDIILNNTVEINQHNLDFIVFVGDAEGHDVYNQSKPQHLDLMEDWINLLKDGLDQFNIPIFFDLGNHEGLPVDNFGGPGVDDWFNNPLGKWLQQWIDTNYSSHFDSQKPSTIMSYSGYYTSLIRPGFRLISINTGYINGGNYYLTFTQFDDPYIDIGGQLKWLNSTLYAAKYKLNETVVIIMHHPIKASVNQFQNSYYQLYDDYKDIILIIFAGHTHCDHYHVLGNNNFSNSSSMNNNKPFATWYSAGSVTQRGGRNPSFRIYKYNRENNQLINYYHYRFDTNLSNIQQKPIWFQSYDFVNEYNEPDISAQSMTNVAYKLQTNDTLWNRFQMNYYNGIHHTKLLDRNGTVCDLLTATNKQYNDCRNNIFASNISVSEYQKLYW